MPARCLPIVVLSLAGCQGTTIDVRDMDGEPTGDAVVSPADTYGGDTATSQGDTTVGDPGPAGARLIAHFPFDDGSGSALTDVVSGDTGVLNNMEDAAWILGRTGDALQFDEVDDYVSLPDLAYGPAFTLAFWFRVVPNGGDGFKYALSHGAFDVQNNLQVFVTEEARANPFEVGTCLEDDDDIVDCTALGSVLYTIAVDDDWHHYALAVSTTGAQVYLDGVAGPAGGNGGGLIDPAGAVILGARSDFDPARFFGGALDDLRIYDDALSAQDVADLVASAP